MSRVGFKAFAKSELGQSFRIAARQAAGGGVSATVGVLQGLSNTEHIPTGNPSVAGLVGAAAGRYARSYAIDSDPRFNPIANHRARTLPLVARQQAQAKTMGTRVAVIGPQTAEDKESGIS